MGITVFFLHCLPFLLLFLHFIYSINNHCILSSTFLPSNNGHLLSQFLLSVPTVTPSPTPEPEIHFTKSHYEAKYLAAQAPHGAQVINISLTVEHPQLILSWTHNFGLYGFYSDYFSIGHTSGVITVATAVRPNVYTFDVTAFIMGTFANGTNFTNFTEADVSVLVHG